MAKQSLTTRVKELTAKVASLEQKNEELECTVKDLKLQISKINKFIQNKFGTSSIENGEEEEEQERPGRLTIEVPDENGLPYVLEYEEVVIKPEIENIDDTSSSMLENAGFNDNHQPDGDLSTEEYEEVDDPLTIEQQIIISDDASPMLWSETNNDNEDEDEETSSNKLDMKVIPKNSKPNIKARKQKFACTHLNCGKEFSRKSNLSAHVKTHKQQKFPCDWHGCERLFSRARDIPRHKQLHKTPLKPLICQVSDCIESFENKNLLDEHLKTIHQLYKCNFANCNKEFKSQSLMITHQNEHSSSSVEIPLLLPIIS